MDLNRRLVQKRQLLRSSHGHQGHQVLTDSDGLEGSGSDCDHTSLIRRYVNIPTRDPGPKTGLSDESSEMYYRSDESHQSDIEPAVSDTARPGGLHPLLGFRPKCRGRKTYHVKRVYYDRHARIEKSLSGVAKTTFTNKAKALFELAKKLGGRKKGAKLQPSFRWCEKNHTNPWLFRVSIKDLRQRGPRVANLLLFLRMAYILETCCDITVPAVPPNYFAGTGVTMRYARNISTLVKKELPSLCSTIDTITSGSRHRSRKKDL